MPYIEQDDDYYYEDGDDYEYLETEEGWRYVEYGDDGSEYTEGENYGGGGSGCVLALLALPGAGTALGLAADAAGLIS